jgi:lantibiotic biosynthesis protein
MPRTNGPFLSAAEAIGHRICDLATARGDTFGWMGPLPTVVDGEWGTAMRELGPDLYGGTSGIALFLARLHERTGEPRFAQVAAGAARDAVARLGDVPHPLRSGLYTGFGGIALAAFAVGDALGDDAWVETGLRLARLVARLDPATQSRDLLSGSAGAIALLVAIGRRFGGEELLEDAARVGRFLVGAARDDGDASSWSTVGTASVPGAPDLTGLSHGASGLAFALLELHAATGDDRFLEVATRAFTYEARWFDPARGNWADVRALNGAVDPPDAAYLVQWCYGAAGTGLAELRAAELRGHDGHAARARAAAATVADDLRAFPHNAQPNYSLCHGVCGNADLLLETARTLGDPAIAGPVEAVALQGIERYGDGAEAWPSGAANGAETASLMWGLAGTGYFYLRMASFDDTPSVLLPTRM